MSTDSKKGRETMRRGTLRNSAWTLTALGLAVALSFWFLGLMKHPPMLLKNVHPLAAGLCAGLGVHIARFWLR